MPSAKNKIDQLHDQLPKLFNTRVNPNWKALVEAIGESDNTTAQLIEEVRKQFFIKTASRPYLDRLAANNMISRPRLVGMDDASFKQYIPILAYQPKQVKLIIDSLLDIFFFKESTTAFVQTIAQSPFRLENGWELELLVDGINTDRIIFKTEDFSDINNATAEEVVAAINRQSKYSFAIPYYDSILKQTFIRLFTETVGSKGSLEFLGGRAIIGLKPNGLILNSGNGSNTQWTVTKIGDTVTFTHTGGTSPGLEFIRKKDLFISDITDNKGSFIIQDIDLANNRFTILNLFATAGTYTQSSETDSKFLRPNKFLVHKQDRRAMAWEVEQGKIVVETPTSPPVVKRELKGSIHLNGPISLMTNRVSDTSLSIEDASSFPSSGSFIVEWVKEIKTKVNNNTEDVVISQKINERVIGEKRVYTYTSKTGNTLTGISPVLPIASSLQDFNISSISATGTLATATTASSHIYNVGDKVIITGSSGILASTTTGDTTNTQPYINNVASIANIQIGSLVTGTGIPPETKVISIIGNTIQISKNAIATNTGISFSFYDDVNKEHIIISKTSNTFTFSLLGTTGTAPTPGESHREFIGISLSGSKIILNKSQKNTGILGSYLYDLKAPFVLSSITSTITDNIKAGKIVRTLNIGSNIIPNQEGFIIFDYGLNTQEGPVRFLYKASDDILVLDPSYVFQKDHSASSAITMISRKGPPVLSKNGKEYAGYITDPTAARQILQDLILNVKSAGIFVEFLVRFPENLYGTLDVYSSGTL